MVETMREGSRMWFKGCRGSLKAWRVMRSLSSTTGQPVGWGRKRYNARFSKMFLKKEKKLPSDVKSRVVEALRNLLINPYIGAPLIAPLKVYGG